MPRRGGTAYAAPVRAARPIAILLALLGGAASTASAWRSRLYPADWTPAHSDGGRRLADFSYAGYHGGADAIPDDAPGPLVDATAYGADPSGAADSTAAIQAALDDVGARGGGVVHLPAGTYRVAPPAGRTTALLLRHDGVVLRGDGPGATFLLNDETSMRDRRIVTVAPREEYYAWWWDPRDARPLAGDAARGSTEVRVDDASGYAVGDLVLVGADATDAFVAEHGMTGVWSPADTSGPIFLRRIARIDGGVIALDAPLQYDLRMRDGARLFRPGLAPVREVGVERLSIGNRENRTPGVGDDDHARAGTGAHEMHASFAIYLDHVVDGWIRDVATYRPAGNSGDVHVLSNAVRVDWSRHVTLTGLDLASPQYRGAGGNGYLVTLTANDTLVTRSRLRGGRHNVSLSFMHSSGNVVHRVALEASRLPADFHQRLAFANLFDGVSVDDDSIELAFRDCCGHGHGTTESVVWNLEGRSYPRDQLFDRFAVDTQQFGHGYVIGTRGAATRVRARTGDGTEPLDLVEGEGEGDSLEPPSLYEDQRFRRLGIPPDEPPPRSDAGVPGVSDGGTARDAGGPGVRDAAASLDGGPLGAEPPPAGGCAVRPGRGPAVLSLVLLVAASRRRRA